MLHLRNLAPVLSVDEARQIAETRLPIFVKYSDHTIHTYVYSPSVTADKTDPFIPSIYTEIASSVMPGGWVLVSRRIKVVDQYSEIATYPDPSALLLWNGILYRFRETTSLREDVHGEVFVVNSSVLSGYWEAVHQGEISMFFYVSDTGDDNNSGLEPTSPIWSIDGILNKFGGENNLPFLNVYLYGNNVEWLTYSLFRIRTNVKLNKLYAVNVALLFADSENAFVEANEVNLMNSMVGKERIYSNSDIQTPALIVKDRLYINDPNDWKYASYSNITDIMLTNTRSIARVFPHTEISVNMGEIWAPRGPTWAMFQGRSYNVKEINAVLGPGVLYWTDGPAFEILSKEDIINSGYGALKKIRDEKIVEIARSPHDKTWNLIPPVYVDYYSRTYKPIKVAYSFAFDTNTINILQYQPEFYLYPVDIRTALGHESYIYMRNNGYLQVMLDPGELYTFIAPPDANVTVYVLDFSNVHPIDINTWYSNPNELSFIEINQTLFNSSNTYLVVLEKDTGSSIVMYLPENIPPIPETAMREVTTGSIDIRQLQIDPNFYSIQIAEQGHPYSILWRQSDLADGVAWRIRAVSTVGAPPTTIGTAYYGHMEYVADSADYELYYSELVSGYYMGWILKNTSPSSKVFKIKISLL